MKYCTIAIREADRAYIRDMAKQSGKSIVDTVADFCLAYKKMAGVPEAVVSKMVALEIESLIALEKKNAVSHYQRVTDTHGYDRDPEYAAFLYGQVEALDIVLKIVQGQVSKLHAENGK